jgi:hypothetical protein
MENGMSTLKQLATLGAAVFFAAGLRAVAAERRG